MLPQLYSNVPLTHPAWPKIEEMHGLKLRYVPLRIEGPLGGCYWTVAKAVSLHGGAMKLCWRFKIVANSVITGDHHAVWESPQGEILDVTESAVREVNNSVIALDESIKPDISLPPYIPLKYIPLRESKAIRDFIAADSERVDLQRRCTTEAAASGASFDGPKPHYKDLRMQMRHEDLVRQAARKAEVAFTVMALEAGCKFSRPAIAPFLPSR